jgi:hypothetical protein
VLLMLRKAFFRVVCSSLFTHPLISISKWRVRIKFQETLWFFLFYSCSFAFGLYSVLPQLQCWLQVGFHDVDFAQFAPLCGAGADESLRALCQCTSIDHMQSRFWIRAYFVSQMIFYMHALIVVFEEERRKDFYVMVGHHVITLFVVFLSYAWPILNGAFAVLMLHDATDILLYLAKLLHYSKQRDAVTTSVFVLFAAMFFTTRILLFPYVVIVHGTWLPLPLWVACAMYFPLFGLYCMHIYWFSLICKMIKRAVVKKDLQKDIRSDDEDEE